MKKSLSLVLIAILAFGIGIAYAAPMLTIPNTQLYPRVFEGPKAKFSVDIVYANFNATSYQKTSPFYNQDGTLNHTETYPETDVNYNIVLNITNTADTPATLYQILFAAAQNVTVRNSILGGTIYDNGFRSTIDLGAYRHFGGVVEGVYLDGKWVNTTWIPNFYDEINGTSVQVPYPLCLYRITMASWYGGYVSGPLNPDGVAAFSADHSINGTIPSLPENASNTGIWFEGVPITEYYDLAGNPLLTVMYINGAWVDVTNRVTVDQTQPMLTASDMIVNQVLPLGASPYENINSTLGEVTTLPTWGDWGVGGAYCWFPYNWASQPFNNTFAPHESRLIMINNTQATGNLAVLESGNIVLYASASNYITNGPVNGTYLNTASTTTQIKQLHLHQTDNGYLYNAILADNQTFQQISNLEVKIAPRTEP
jgi:hypothetical protein